MGQRFSPKRVEEMDGQIRSLVTELLENIEGKRDVDLAKELAVQLPLRVILELFLGVPEQDRDKMYDLAVQMLQPDPDDSDEQKHESRRRGPGANDLLRCTAHQPPGEWPR